MTCLASIVSRYYPMIDANDVDAVLLLFADQAVYERADSRYVGKARLDRFFRRERLIRGIHEMETVAPINPSSVLALGCFIGTGADGGEKSVAFADVWEADDAMLIKRRRTYLSLGADYVLR